MEGESERISPPPRPTNSVEIVILDDSLGWKKITINGFTFSCSEEYIQCAVQRELDYIQSTYEQYVTSTNETADVQRDDPDISQPSVIAPEAKQPSADETPTPTYATPSCDKRFPLIVGAVAVACICAILFYIRKKQK